MNRDDVLEIIREARDSGKTPDLRWANLRRVDLSWADLHGVDLRGADLSGADLRVADLHGGDLSGVDLRGADLSGANLCGADLHGGDLSGVDLRGADLSGANLCGADLYEANLCGGLWDGLCIDGIHPYRCLLAPTPDGWEVTVGCWSGTVTELRSLIASDDGWPEATGEQIAERRPPLSAFCDLCDVHMAAHPSVIVNLAARWSA